MAAALGLSPCCFLGGLRLLEARLELEVDEWLQLAGDRLVHEEHH